VYPDADIPIVQMSIDETQPASFHFDYSNRKLSFECEQNATLTMSLTCACSARPCDTFADDDAGSHGIAGRHPRHDRAICDAKVFDSIDLTGVCPRSSIGVYFGVLIS
jgi:hypothetical protein